MNTSTIEFTDDWLNIYHLSFFDKVRGKYTGVIMIKITTIPME